MLKMIHCLLKYGHYLRLLLINQGQLSYPVHLG